MYSVRKSFLVKWLSPLIKKILYEELASINNQIITETVPAITKEVLLNYLIVGDNARLEIHETAEINNAFLNVLSGCITIEENVFFGHNVSLLTGTHDISIKGADRKHAIPREGRDIVIRKGVWIASNATVIGPSEIGEDSVIGACSLVIGNVLPNSFYAGVPAKLIKKLN